MAFQHLGLNLGGQGGPPAHGRAAAVPHARTRIGLNAILNNDQPIQNTDNRDEMWAEIQRLRARLEGMEPNAPQQMFSDPDDIQRARERAASTPKKKILSAVIPGYKSDALTVVLSPKVEDLFRDWKYVPYPALTPAAREVAARGDDEYSAVYVGEGGMTFRAKSVSRKNETSISSSEWHAAAELAEDKIHQYHGNERATALRKHHGFVTNLSVQYSHKVAMLYGIKQRDMLYSDLKHDISTLDGNCLLLCTHIARSQSDSSTGISSGSTSRKRSVVDLSDDEEQVNSLKSSKQKANQSHCFRCGYFGHLAANCKSETTIAGKPCATLAGNPRFKHALRAQNGKEFCFRFASFSNCSSGNSCDRIHRCSICLKKHGAVVCPQVDATDADDSFV
ncbi:hypothetical protein C8R43DRAFT_1017235 [Mycena crocata]|nr:hypothetical protein C8R43DRAFT_1017235 [Mycena crocata]